ncbi:DUF3953 domain-containing protein [Alkalihalophilus lindianensis]|uniref:DUF3953 domain-containing protein n=1 Tax=Alkalihalophilus lindianensis TaxID=1630542 RepID=A0ABU3X804_9BACI|nr:DUF3953 domain-containing protein [Alkalihalophilus lindianensis]MDV2684015.1 DUF3953 domain-containing protein [Alkalihalophilus lindianensis]
MKILRLILAIIVVALSIYALITGITGAIIPYVLFFLALILLVTGITEFREKRKATAITLFFVTEFNFYVSFNILFN